MSDMPGAFPKTPEPFSDTEVPPLRNAGIPFDDAVQSGVVQPGQAHLNLLGFNISEGVPPHELAEHFRELTTVARSLQTAQPIAGFSEADLVSVLANLTVTCGFGERIFDLLGKPQIKPEGLHDVPAFSLDKLQDRWGQTDFVLQVCCDDPVTISNVTRLLVRTVRPWGSLTWLQRGFDRAWGSVVPGSTPRNPMGQVDGTVNPRTDEEYAEQVWIESENPALNNSCIMVVRRIAMNLDGWEGLDVPERERIIGRDYHTGAPLSGGESEFDEEDMDAVDENGSFLIDRHSHLALSREQDGQPNDALRRRAYAYSELPDAEKPYANGLVWICFQKNPDKQFTPIQQRLDKADLLNAWIAHIGSAVYWIAPGTTPDTYWGQGIFEA